MPDPQLRAPCRRSLPLSSPKPSLSPDDCAALGNRYNAPMTRRFQFSLRALLLAISFAAIGFVFVRLATNAPVSIGVLWGMTAAACFGAAIGSVLPKPMVGVPLGLGAGPVVLYLGLKLLFDW